MYRGIQVDVYTRMQNLTSEPKARTVKLHPGINSVTAYPGRVCRVKGNG